MNDPVPVPLPAAVAARPRGPTLVALGWMTLAGVLFSVMNVLGRVAATSAPWATVAAVRAIVGALVAFAVVRYRGSRPVRLGTRAIWLRSISGTTAMALTFYVLGSPGIALGDAVTLFNLGPVFLAVLAPIALGERSGLRRLVVAIPLAIIGVILVDKPVFVFGGAGGSDRTLLGFALGAAFFSSVAMLGLRKVGQRESAESIALHFSTTAAIVLTLVALPGLALPSARELAAMVGAGICAGSAQIAMTRAYTVERAAVVASYGYLNVVVTALLGVLVLGEQPDAKALVGMALVVASGLVVTLAGVREERTSRPAAEEISRAP